MSMTSDLCTEEEIAALVNGFYGRVREDPLLSPVFAEHVKDWDAHLPKMVDFWSSALRKTARYRGTPMPKHAALPAEAATLRALADEGPLCRRSCSVAVPLWVVQRPVDRAASGHFPAAPRSPCAPLISRWDKGWVAYLWMT